MILQILQDTTIVQVSDTIRTISINPPETFLESLAQPVTIIALTAIVVSILGLIISVCYNRKSLKITIEHNKKSVEPKIDHLHMVNAHEYKEYCELKNNGYGPAMIKEIKFYYQGNIYEDIVTLYKKHFNGNISKIEKEKIYQYKDYPLASNSSILLYEFIYAPEYFKNNVDGITSFLEDILIEINYETVYNELKNYRKNLRYKINKIFPK